VYPLNYAIGFSLPYTRNFSPPPLWLLLCPSLLVGVVSLFLSSLDVSICTYPLLHVHVLVHVIRGLPLLTECSGWLLTCRSCLKKNLPHTTFYFYFFLLYAQVEYLVQNLQGDDSAVHLDRFER
jgi:hypothetical protein